MHHKFYVQVQNRLKKGILFCLFVPQIEPNFVDKCTEDDSEKLEHAEGTQTPAPFSSAFTSDASGTII